MFNGTLLPQRLLTVRWDDNSYIRYVKTQLFQFAIQKVKIKICRTTILPVVLYGYETWSLTLREERRLRMFENRVLRRVFGPKKDEVTGEWRKIHIDELNDLYC